MGSFATPEDLYKRHDIRLIQDLCQDDGTRPTRPAMLTDDIVEEMLADASGDVEMALISGGRYTLDNIATIQLENGNSNQVLKRMTCDISMAYLFDRRPTYQPTRQKAYRANAEILLERLRTGAIVFNLPASVAAGEIFISAATIQDYQHMNLTADQVGNRYYVPRRTRLFNGIPQ